MFPCLNSAMIGHPMPPVETIKAAAHHGFGGVDLQAQDDLDEAAVAQALKAAGLARGVWNGLLPVNMAAAESVWQECLRHLPRRAAQGAKLGFTRSTVVILPFHEVLNAEQNMAVLKRRLSEALPIFAAHGITLGLEYVAPLTRRRGQNHEFLHNFQGLRPLLEGPAPRPGFLFDAFHWYCAGEGPEIFKQLSADQIVTVHACDAVSGRSRDEQIAFERELPGKTGMVDFPTLMTQLKGLNYQGPVTAEPMNSALKTMAPGEALAATIQSLKAVLGR